MHSAESGLCSTSAASQFGNRNIIDVLSAPRAKKVHEATEKVRLTCIGLPCVFAALIIRDSATGSPAVASIRKTLNTLYADKNSAYPSSPRRLPIGIL